MQRYYCGRYNIPYFCIADEVVQFRGNTFEKMQFLQLLKQFEQVLFFDADVMPTLRAKNVFDIATPDKFWAFDENIGVPPAVRDHFVEPLGVTDWPKNDKGLCRFFNSGVFVVSREHVPAFEGFRDSPDIAALWHPFRDQAYLNYMVVMGGLLFGDLPRSFNFMSLGQAVIRKERLAADFVHYAGPVGFYDYADKSKLIEDDYLEMKDENH